MPPNKEISLPVPGGPLAASIVVDALMRRPDCASDVPTAAECHHAEMGQRFSCYFRATPRDNWIPPTICTYESYQPIQPTPKAGTKRKHTPDLEDGVSEPKQPRLERG
eukprot:GHVO01025879.1.p1 GENE.GHVO01025879.1~~GHVO01025879.1.p1  ORF type:complete len:118 (+),score=8.77 GHVO01025879.1:33-356(+)